MVDSSTLSWFRSEILIFGGAAIGGVLVLIGLWMEYVSTDEKRYENVDIDGFRALKSKEKRGEKLVMWGIILEIMVAVIFAGRDDWHVRQMDIANKNADPRNQPINAISGYAIVEVRAKGSREINLAKNLHQILEDRNGINFDLTTSQKLQQNPEIIELLFGKSPTEAPLEPPGSVVIVGWIDSVNTISDDSKPYVPNFGFVLHFSGGSLWNRDAVTFNELKFVQIEGLGNAGEVQPPLEVIGGQITLKVNLDWPKTFRIPKQTNQFWRVSSLETNGEFVPAGYGNLTNSSPAK
jgi:hypothetical protein